MSDDLETPNLRGWSDYIEIGLRRRWWILLSVFFCWAAVEGGSWFLPATYQSEATILVEQQKVPDQYVAPNVAVTLQDRLQNITQEILSRTRLQAMIDRYGLYSRPDNMFHPLIKPKEPIDQMRDDIQIELVRTPGYAENYSAFKITYTAVSPELAQRVNNGLTSLFVEENVRTQQQLSQDTTAFLQDELAQARIKMEEQEARVAAFKAKHIGDLPGQVESNVQILAGLQSQLESTQRALDLSKQQKIYLESLLQQYQSTEANLPGDDSPATPVQMLDNELADLRHQLNDLQTRYTNDHPDIVALNSKIETTETLEKQAEAESIANQKTGKTTGPRTASTLGVPREPSNAVMQIQSQLKANQLEIQDERQHETDLESEISGYQGRLNLTPEIEQELTDISRGYEESKANYTSLLQKQMQSQLATNLEERQEGEQFRIIDPASLPTKPVAPNRLRISLGGLAAGLVLGATFAAFLEMTDSRVRREKDLEGIVPVSILVGIPHLTTSEEKHARRWTKWIEVGAVAAMAILISAANLYLFHKS